MGFLRPTWQLASTLAIVLAGTAYLLGQWRGQGSLDGTATRRRVDAVRSFAREFAIVAALFALWQIVGGLARTHSAGAFERAAQIERLENWLPLPSQAWLQHLVLPHSWLVESMNLYYLFAHFNGTGLFLFWVWWKRRDAFHTVRNTVIGTTLISLILQLIPVAPPRLMPHGRFTDTALVYSQSAYGTYADGFAAQLTAMPSVHVAWAVIVAWYVARLGRGPLRWAGVVHLVLTVLVVVATANHWWMDGVVAAVIVALVIWAQALLTRRFAPEEPPGPQPVVLVGETS